MNISIFIILGYTLASLWELFCKYIINKTSLIIRGYRLHHSLYGIVLIIIGTLMDISTPLSIGIGIIIQHTVTDGFRFISKN